MGFGFWVQGLGLVGLYLLSVAVKLTVSNSRSCHDHYRRFEVTALECSGYEHCFFNEGVVFCGLPH